jgi:NTP pyrophosphatase (non-canonical NTP hydrolase)
MTFDEYQRSAARTLNPALDERGRLVDAAAGLSEEAGEALAHVRKHVFQGRPLERDRLAEELGDALWCLAATAGAIGVSLGSIAAGNLEKIERRASGG